MEGADRTRGLRCQAAGPVGGGRAWPGFETTHPATHSDTSAAGVEGAGGHGGPGCGARGRQRGLAGLQDDAPSHTQRHKRRRCGGCRRARRARLRGPWAAAGPGRASRRRAQPHTATQAPPVWRVPEGPEGQGGLRDRPLRAVGSRVAISRAAGPDGTRNTDGTTSKTISQVARRPRAHQAARPQHTHSDACPHTIQA